MTDPSKHRVKRNMAIAAFVLSILWLVLSSFDVMKFGEYLTHALTFFGGVIGNWAVNATIEDGFGK